MNILVSSRTKALSRDSSLDPGQRSFAEDFAMAFGVCTPLLGLICGILLGWGHGIGWTEITLLAVFYCITGLSVTMGFHRLFTHRAFEAAKPIRFLLAVGASMSVQGPLIEWCAMHRRHHQHSDRDGDPHSPHLHGHGVAATVRGMWHAHLGWLFDEEPEDLYRSAGDLVADPILTFVDRYFWVWVALGWLIPAAIGAAVHRSWMGALYGFIWGGLVRTFLLHHVTWSINSVCHVWGTRPFQSADYSRNNAIFGVLAFGEGWHNNHHAFPTSARHGLKWWQIDMTYLLIRSLECAGLAWNVRTPAPGAMALRERPPQSATIPIAQTARIREVEPI